MTTLRLKCSKQEALELVRRAKHILSGKESDPTGLAARLLDRLGRVALKIIRDSFNTKIHGGRDASGLRWDAIKPATIYSKRKRRGSHEILLDSKDLLNSLSEGSKDNVFAVEAKQSRVRVGTRTPYGKYHHSSSTRKSKLPRRPLWQDAYLWPAEWRRQLLQPARSALVEMIIALARLDGLEAD